MVETHGGRRFAALFFVAAFLVLFLGHWLKPVDDLALSAAAPFAAAVSTVANGVGDAVSGISEGPKLRSQNQTLRKQIGMLVRKNALLQQEAHENRIYRRMLKFDDLNSHLDLTTARVIGDDPNSIAPYVLINRGSRDGLKTGMTVVDRDGYFVGSISDLTSNAGKVLLMMSPSSSVGAVDLKTHATGLVEGQFAANPQLRWVTASSALRIGDLIVTSGQLNLFPRNILIGQVIGVTSRSDALFQTAEVRPAANFQDLELVQVVRNFTPSEPNRLITKH